MTRLFTFRASNPTIGFKVLWALIACLIGPSRCAQPSPTVTLAAVGDVLLDRSVRRDIQRFGIAYPFSATAKMLSGADVTFANLECPLAVRCPKSYKTVSFKADSATAQCLSGAGIDVVSLANNHALDCGVGGLRETFAALKRHKVLWCGAGRNHHAAQLATRLTVNGVRLAFVAFTEFTTEPATCDDAPSIAVASPTTIRRSVTAARVGADVVIASFHWGVEGASRPCTHQEMWAHLAVQCGADVVLGHHPHVLQGMEIVPRQSTLAGLKRHALIAYSLGNFVFDAPRYRDKRTAQSLILRVALDRNGVRSAEVVPIAIEGARPIPVEGGRAAAIMHRLSELSGELGTRFSGSSVVIDGA